MDFGKVSSHVLAQVDFRLPADGSQTDDTLYHLSTTNTAEFYIGCAKWGRKEWVNMIYPPKTKEANFLDEYVKHFNSIELNAVFYSIPSTDLIRKWRDKAELNAIPGFKFCPKFSRTISHIKRLKDADIATDLYLSSIYEFGDFLGPCFLQLGDNFSPTNFSVLESYLEKLPVDLQLFVEVRHEAWFSDPDIREKFFKMLARLNKGAVITDGGYYS